MIEIISFAKENLQTCVNHLCFYNHVIAYNATFVLLVVLMFMSCVQYGQ